jgi:hypothetical protein
MNDLTIPPCLVQFIHTLLLHHYLTSDTKKRTKYIWEAISGSLLELYVSKSGKSEAL